MPESQTALSSAFEWIGSVISIGYFLTPLYQIIFLYKGRLHVKQIPVILLLSILLNCMLWFLFGLMRRNVWISMLVTNSIGLVFNVVILFLYLYLLCDKHIWKFIGYGLFVLNLLAEVCYLMFKYIIKWDSGEEQPVEFDTVGFCGMVVNVIMYASPCLNIIDLFKTKQMQFMPILTNIIGFFSALVWLFYGLINRHDRTMISNGISLFVLIIQIGIWFYFFYSASKQKQHLIISNSLEKVGGTEESQEAS